MRRLMVLFALLSATVSVPSAAQLESDARWRLVNAGDRCLLRPADAGQKPAPPTFTVMPLRDDVDIEISLRGRQPSKPTPAVVTGTPSASRVTGEFHPAEPSRAVQAYIRIPRSILESLSSDLTVTVAVGKATSAPLPIAGLREGLRALGSCQAAILTKMGYRPGEATPVPPGGWEDNSREWIKDSDYPRDLLANGRGGAMLLGWIIGIDGRVRNCTALIPSNEPTLDAAACAALSRRGKYSPSIDRDGNAVELFGSRIIRFDP